MAIEFTNSQLKAIAVMSWGVGVSPLKLAEIQKMKLSNCLTEIIDPLVSRGIFYYGEARKTGRPGRPSKPLYLTDNEYVLKDIEYAIEKRWGTCLKKSKMHEKSYSKIKNDALKYRIFRNDREIISLKIQYWATIRGLFAQGLEYKRNGRLPVHGHSDVVFNPPENVHSPAYAEYLKMGGV